jgi:superfamily II DNA or RNA helicase
MPPVLTNVFEYMRKFSGPMGERIMQAYPPLHAPGEPASPRIAELKRPPLAAQELAIMGTAKYLKNNDAAKVIAEMGCGKTYMGLGSCYVHADGKQHSGVVMCPPHLVLKWAREIFITVPNTRVFLIEDMRNLPIHDSKKLADARKKPHGVVEVKYIDKEVVRRGESFSITKLRELGSNGFKKKLNGVNAWFVMSKERGKLSYYWRAAGETAESGKHLGYLANPDTGAPVEMSGGGYLSFLDLKTNKKFQERIQRGKEKDGTTMFSPMWSADRMKIQRMAPLDFMGRYMKGFFDYAIADELHQLAGDTAQGNGLAVLSRISHKLIGLTGTSFDGYADSQFNVIYRMDGPQMVREGFAWGGEGRKLFQSTYGVIEEIRKREATDNRSSRNTKETVTIKRRPGCSPVLFGRFLMESTAFVSLEDIAKDLPSYNEYPIAVEMDKELEDAYRTIEREIKDKLREYPRNASLTSMMLQTLLCYPDHPFGFKMLKAKVQGITGPEIIDVCLPPSLSQKKVYAKERALIEDIRQEIAEGRKVQVFATFTGDHDVTLRLKQVIEREGFRVAVMKSTVPTEKREAWYAARSKEGYQVIICHPKLVETGLDLLEYPTIAWFESGYSLHTLRQASRRSWRIGQRYPVRVKFYYYAGTAQEKCIRLMGRKLLVSLMMEGKMSGEGLEDMDDGDDMVTAMVKELLSEGGVGESADDIWKNLERERRIHTDASLTHTPAPAPTSAEVEEALDRVAAESDLVSADAPTGVAEIAQEVVDYADSKTSGLVLEQNGLALFYAQRTH